MKKPNAEISSQRFDTDMPDYSDPSRDDFAAQSRDTIPVRSMREDDLETLVRIDRKLTGRERGGAGHCPAADDRSRPWRRPRKRNGARISKISIKYTDYILSFNFNNFNLNCLILRT